MKQKNKKILIVVIALAVLAGVYIYYMGGTPSEQGTTFIDKVTDKVNSLISGVEDRGSNGWYDPVSGQCWTTPTSLNGGTHDVACCFDIGGYQVDCKDASKKLSNTQVVFAVYFPAGGVSTPGIYNVMHTITLTNTMNIDFTKVWIESASWTSSPSQSAGNTEINTGYVTMVGFNNAMAGGPLTVAAGPSHTRSFSSGMINLQLLSPDKNTPVTYTSAIVAKGSYLAGATPMNWTSPTKVLTFVVTKEEAGFDITINWGI